MPNKRLGHILLQQGLIDDQKLEFCLKVQKNNGGERIGKVLKHYNFINEDQIANALAKQIGWDVYSGDYQLDEAMFTLFGRQFMLERMVFPAGTRDGTVFVLARTDDMATTDMIQARLNTKARFCIGSELRLRQALEKIVSREKNLKEDVRVPVEDDLVIWLEKHLDSAIAKGATDIHIEASEKAVEIRLRIDGILYFVDSLRLDHLPRLVNVVFHKSDVTISDFGHFHDARFIHRHLNCTVDVRVSHIPSVYGSSIVLRLLDQSKASIALTSLGYSQKQWESIEASLVKPEGITLIVGPTGCGKTTTLYSMLNHLKSISRKIISIEDPVEMHLPLMVQVQTNDKREITFGNAVRAFLRHDPNIILIGEIRDKETAQEALRAAMTGHKVFATLHANRPVDAILRLHDLGVPYTHMAGNINMIATQRLLRRLCPICKIGRDVFKSKLLVHERKHLEQEEQEIFAAHGCSQCEGGFHGRTIVAEVLAISNDIEGMIGEGDITGLRKYLNSCHDYITLFDDARRLIKEGTTSIGEAARILG